MFQHICLSLIDTKPSITFPTVTALTLITFLQTMVSQSFVGHAPHYHFRSRDAFPWDNKILRLFLHTFSPVITNSSLSSSTVTCCFIRNYVYHDRQQLRTYFQVPNEIVLTRDLDIYRILTKIFKTRGTAMHEFNLTNASFSSERSFIAPNL